MADLKYVIEKHIGVFSPAKRGWTKELNLVSWGDNPAKYDLRPWDEAHTKMGKGITLTAEELIALRDLLNELSL